jgi:hypothetical protein
MLLQMLLEHMRKLVSICDCRAVKWVMLINLMDLPYILPLPYKPEGRGFDSLWGEFLNLPNLSGRTRPWGLLIL